MTRFFSDSSFWNTPLGRYPEVDPDSEKYLEILDREFGGPFWININQYTIPVYETDSTTPRRTVHQLEFPEERKKDSRWGARDSYFSHGPGFGEDIPIPDYAVPDPAGDKHMALISREENTAWDMWYCVKRDDGEWASYTGMKYPLDSKGVWKHTDFPVSDGDSIHFHGPGRAAGVPIIAGLIMLDEIQAGRIEHKLAYATWQNALKKFVSPAAWTDGFREEGLPEGAVMQINPALHPEDFGLSDAGKVVFRALQEYGMVNVDNARANTLYAEGCYGQPDKSWEGILPEHEFEKVPLECYRVLKLGDIVEMGDHKKVTSDQ